MKKILAIGNSFSQDATRYLQEIAASAGEELLVRNLYIGGCSLALHAENVRTNAAAYQYEEETRKLCMISIPDALKAEDWDFVTIQQASHDSGMPETYDPHMSFLIDTIKEALPNAKIAFHRTWAYEINSGHNCFVRYNKSQLEMYGAIVAASTYFAAKHGIPVIRTGDFIQVLRGISPFDYKNGGTSLCRDGFHLSLDYGRFAAAVCWFKFFTGRSAEDITFAPEGTEKDYIDVIKKTADMML